MDLGFALTTACCPPLPLVPWYRLESEAESSTAVIPRVTSGSLADRRFTASASGSSRRRSTAGAGAGSGGGRRRLRRAAQLAMGAATLQAIRNRNQEEVEGEGGEGCEARCDEGARAPGRFPAPSCPAAWLLVGTRWTACPEIWRKSVPYDPAAADAYSLGATLFLVATGTAPALGHDLKGRGAVGQVRSGVTSGEVATVAALRRHLFVAGKGEALGLATGALHGGVAGAGSKSSAWQLPWDDAVVVSKVLLGGRVGSDSILGGLLAVSPERRKRLPQLLLELLD